MNRKTRNVVLAIVATSLLIAAGWAGVHQLRRIAVNHNLKMLYTASLQYRQAHQNKAPPSIEVLLREFEVKADQVLIDPITGRSEANAYIMFDNDDHRLPANKFMFGYEQSNGLYIVMSDDNVYWVDRRDMEW